MKVSNIIVITAFADIICNTSGFFFNKSPSSSFDATSLFPPYGGSGEGERGGFGRGRGDRGRGDRGRGRGRRVGGGDGVSPGQGIFRLFGDDTPSPNGGGRKLGAQPDTANNIPKGKLTPISSPTNYNNKNVIPGPKPLN
jgi:hypothetical protein